MLPEGHFDISITRKSPGGGGWGPWIVGLFLLVAMAAGIEGYFKGPATSAVPAPAPAPRPAPPPPRPISEIHFVAIGPQQFPSPFPRPDALGRTADGKQVFGWRGRRWFLSPPPPNRYAYLCDNGGLSWCWRNPPNPSAAPCRQNNTGLQGWCWKLL